MEYAVYADLSRPLTEQERSTIFAALDAIVPDSGCVGLQKGPNDEVYFTVDALSLEEAKAQATQYMNQILNKVELDIGYTLELQKLYRA